MEASGCGRGRAAPGTGAAAVRRGGAGPGGGPQAGGGGAGAPGGGRLRGPAGGGGAPRGGGGRGGAELRAGGGPGLVINRVEAGALGTTADRLLNGSAVLPAGPPSVRHPTSTPPPTSFAVVSALRGQPPVSCNRSRA